MKAVEELTDQQLRNVIENYERKGLAADSYCISAMQELSRRKGNGLNFETSMEVIKKAASERRFISYKQLADASGCEWNKVRYAINAHLGELITYARRNGWPLLSAVVVNQQHLETGQMEETTLRGFVDAARSLGYSVTDELAFLRDQQERVFEWAARKPS